MRGLILLTMHVCAVLAIDTSSAQSYPPGGLFGTVEGTVNNMDIPIAGEVQLLELSATDGYPRFVSRCNQQTDPSGHYLCQDVPAGGYLVLFTPSLSVLSEESNTTEDTRWYSPTYYPGTRSANEAEIIKVVAGTSAIADLHPPQVPARRLQGHISSKPKSAYIGVREHAFGIDIPVNIPVSYQSSSGRFEVPGLLAGTDTIEAQWDSAGIRRTAAASVGDIGVDADFDLHEERLTTITGTIDRSYGRAAMSPTGESSGYSKLVLVLKCWTFGGAKEYREDISMKDSFAFPNVAPGHCALTVENKAGIYISELSRGKDVLPVDNFPLTKGLGVANFALQLQNSYGSISGRVGCAEVCGENVGVVLRSDSSGNSITIKPSPDGKFALNAVPLGEYKVYAWKDISKVAYRSPEYLQKYGRHAEKVAINPNQLTSEVMVDLNDQ